MRALKVAVWCLVALTLGVGFSARAGGQANPNPAVNLYAGSITKAAASAEPLRLSIDDAIRRGLEFNLALLNERQNLRQADGQRLEALQGLLPTVTGEGETGYRELDLVTLGFQPSRAASALPPGVRISPIVKVAFTDAQANLNWPIFSLPAIENYRASREQATSEQYRVRSVRGLVVLNVGTAYLRALALASTMQNATSLLATDREILRQAHEEHLAGTVANLDELRPRVAYQQQEQAVVAAQNAFEKAKIALARQIGLPADQKLQLTDIVPYAELALLDLNEARRRAYRDRQDYQTLEHAARAAMLRQRAARDERLPSLNAGGNYGVTGETTGLYHGTLVAVASVNFPIFREATLRGDADVAKAQALDQQARLIDLRSKIDAQLRASLLDIQAAEQLTAVARNNVVVATTALDQTAQRFQAGVDDTLAVVEAQAQLAGAQNQLVQSLFQLNTAKLGLARNLGAIEYDYDQYLHGGAAAATPIPSPARTP